MDPQLKQQLCQTIYVAGVSSVDSHGDPTYGTASAVLCRCEPDQESSDSPEGEGLITRYRIVTEGLINRTDRIWLPGDSSGTTSLARNPMKVQPCFDENGNLDHCETIV